MGKRSYGIAAILVATALLLAAAIRPQPLVQRIYPAERNWLIANIQEDLSGPKYVKPDTKWIELHYPNAQIGAPIPRYSYFEGQLSLSNLYLFPLLQNGEVVATYSVFIDQGVFFGVFANEWQEGAKEFLKTNKEVAFLSVEGVFYAISNHEIEPIQMGDWPEVSRESAMELLETVKYRKDFQRIRPVTIRALAPVTTGE